jgi:hypothetical protein
VPGGGGAQMSKGALQLPLGAPKAPTRYKHRLQGSRVILTATSDSADTWKTLRYRYLAPGQGDAVHRAAARVAHVSGCKAQRHEVGWRVDSRNYFSHHVEWWSVRGHCCPGGASRHTQPE